MPSSLSINLRERVVATLTGRRDLPWLRRPLRSQRVACQPLGEARAEGGTDRIVGAAQRSALAGHRGPSRSDPATYEAHPAICLDELRDARAVQGVATSTGALARIFARQGITCKRRRCARLNSRGRT